MVRGQDVSTAVRFCTLKQYNSYSDKGTLHPKHVVQATGASGEPSFPSDIQGLSDFKGDCLIHSTQFSKPLQSTKGKKAVVVGACNSGHDIAQEYYQHGYEVTMVQRSSTLVVQSQTLIDVMLKGLYSDQGVSTYISLTVSKGLWQWPLAHRFSATSRRRRPGQHVRS